MESIFVFGLIAIVLLIVFGITVILIGHVFAAQESDCISVKTDTLVIVDGSETTDCSDWVEKFSNLGFKITDYALAENRIAKIVMQK